MIQCPNCRQMIPDDSAFCDQCGKELMWCPECRRPKRGTSCPVCGNDLIPGRKWQAGPGEASPSASLRDPIRANAPGDASPSPSPATKLTGPYTLILQEGAFGRRGGIWPELSSCQYVSGNHGVIGKSGGNWTITDSGSTNGTYVNGVRLSAGVSTPIKAGDKVRIATLDFTVQ